MGYYFNLLLCRLSVVGMVPITLIVINCSSGPPLSKSRVYNTAFFSIEFTLGQ